MSQRPIKTQKEPIKKSLMLALAMHLLLLIALFLSTRWKSSAPAAIEAELWNATPQVAMAVKPPPPATPPPQPEVKPPEPKPAPIEKTPEEPKPDIALEAKRKEEERKKQEQQDKIEKEKLDKLEKEKQEKLEKEKLAKEKKKEEQEKKQLLDQLQREREEKLARLTGNAANTASPNQKSLGTAGVGSRFSIVATGKVKDNLSFPESDYKPATVMVSLAPDGTVLDVKFTKPSGNPAQDAAIERAIRRTARFPPANPGEAYARVELEFKASE